MNKNNYRLLTEEVRSYTVPRDVVKYILDSGFVDYSWHNDEFYHLYHEGKEITLVIKGIDGNYNENWKKGDPVPIIYLMFRGNYDHLIDWGKQKKFLEENTIVETENKQEIIDKIGTHVASIKLIKCELCEKYLELSDKLNTEIIWDYIISNRDECLYPICKPCMSQRGDNNE